MRIKMYTIYDGTAQDSSPPFLAKNDGVAIRTFMTSIPAERTEFKLFMVGIYDMETMEIEVLTPTQVEILI